MTGGRRSAHACGGGRRPGDRRRLRWRRAAAPRSRSRPRTPMRRPPGRCACSPTATPFPTRCSTRSGEANPELDLKVATFDSNKAAAAKLAGGFEADVVEVCTDEMAAAARPRAAPAARPERRAGVRRASPSPTRPRCATTAGEVLFVPASAGPHGLIVNTEAIPDGVDSYSRSLRPRLRGQRRARGDPADRDRGLRAGARIRRPDRTSPTRRSRRPSSTCSTTATTSAPSPNRTPRWSTCSSRARSCSPTADAARPQAMADDGLPVEWVAPKEGALSWVCGLAITSKAQNIDAAYKLINYYASPEAQALSGEMGFVAMNPAALPLVSRSSRRPPTRATSRHAIATTEPDELRRLRARMAGSAGPVAHRPVKQRRCRARLRGVGAAASRLVMLDPVRAGADAGAVLVQRLIDHLAAVGGVHHALVRGGVGERPGS